MALEIDLADGTLFGNDAGEDELPEVLASYFVDQSSFKDFFSRQNAFRIARARKGMGKSALLSKLDYDLNQEPSAPIIIRTTGAGLIGILSPPTDSSYLELQNYWIKVLCARINHELGKHIGFAFSETDMALVESAEIAGFKERNIVGALINRISSSRIPIEVKLNNYSNHEELLRRASERDSEKVVWVLIDDIDSTYIDSEHQQAITSTFFSACRSLVRQIGNVKIRATVRTDVWSSLRKNEDLDKCEQYITDLSWSERDLKYILSKKVSSYFERNYPSEFSVLNLSYRDHADRLLKYAFQDRFRWGGSMVPAFKPIKVMSAGRPRWMSQLCRLSGVEAASKGAPLIGTIHVNAIMAKYSRYRLNDIYKEHSHQYGDLEKLIETFSNGHPRFTTKALLEQISTKYVNSIGSGNIPIIDGYPYKYPMQLAQFLYKCGFILARKEQLSNPNVAEFVKHEERPELLTDHRNADDGMQWEVHPSYRDALNIRAPVSRAATKKATQSKRSDRTKSRP